jgi:uncharacterized protein
VSLIFDTGPLLAVIDSGDGDHQRCVALLAATSEPRVIPAPVLVEVTYWALEKLGSNALIGFLEDVRSAAYAVENLQADDYDRIVDICRQYHDTPVGFVDAAVLAIVERLKEPKLATLDHRHFRMMRPRHVESLRLLPD